MGYPTSTRNSGKSRRDILRMGGAASMAAAGSFPLVSVAGADNTTLKIGYIGCMSGNGVDFGAADPWVLDRVKATVRDGLKIGGKNYAVDLSPFRHLSRLASRRYFPISIHFSSSCPSWSFRLPQVRCF